MTVSHVAYFCAEINCQCSFYLNSVSVYRFLIEYSFGTSVVRKSLETGCCLHIVHITVIVLCNTVTLMTANVVVDRLVMAISYNVLKVKHKDILHTHTHTPI